MSAQSINTINMGYVCDKIDNFLICEGNNFRDIVDYDLDTKVDYKKIEKVLMLKEMLNRTKKCNNILKIIDKILIK